MKDYQVFINPTIERGTMCATLTNPGQEQSPVTSGSIKHCIEFATQHELIIGNAQQCLEYIAIYYELSICKGYSGPPIYTTIATVAPNTSLVV